ncbi:hypothetical protein DFQ50_101284 [Pseudocitrobacter faecalis]|uniref:Uncharacterized protein n=2 Tax=Enterobacteriaceae TaxID=543 RepID=A0ABX9G3D9_9ENTR|nr:hypothetical protein DFQ50_101284 [Pseudocitrobacter faecalis]
MRGSAPLFNLVLKLVMNKTVFCAIALMAVIGVGTHVSAQRAVECTQQGGAEAACVASAWDMEKVNPLPQYNPDNGALEPASNTVYRADFSGR